MEEKASDLDVESEEQGKNPHYNIACEFFSPLRECWSDIQEILLWQKLGVAIVCFNIINGLFWVFLTPWLQNAVSFVILTSLLWLIPPWRQWVLSNISTRKLSAKSRENIINEDSDIEDSSGLVSECEQDKSNEKQTTSYADFCYGMSVVLGFILKYWLKLKSMKEEKPQKFYSVVALLVILVAIVYQRFPVGNIVYLTVMFLFLWPAIVFYGVKDKLVGKFRRLFKPFIIQWQNSQTKRKRNVTLKGSDEESDLSDEDFKLNPSKETEHIFGSVLPVERLRQESRHGHFDSLDSSTISTEGLEFPSLRRGSTESFNSDDFIDGLNFGSFHANVVGSCHSSMDSLVGDVQERANSQNEHIETSSNEEILRESISVTSSIEDQQMRRAKFDEYPAPPPRNRSSDSLQSYEIVDTSEIENISTESEPPSNESSYLATGTGYVGKFFGFT